MTMTDPIADMLTRIRNAGMAGFDTVEIPLSKVKVNIAKVMRAEGFIKNYKILSHKGKQFIRVFMKYDAEGGPVISGLKRVSTPGCRVYTPQDRIPSVLNGYGVNILSTSKGVMTDRDARKNGVGGEILCSIW
jgi:small subunit ribosomal protein S8